jgi:hypothetical protein
VYPKGVMCNATLSDDKNVRLLCYDVYLVDRHQNSLFSFYRNPVINLTFDPNSINMLWTVDHGVLYYLKPDDFNKLKNGTRDITMSRVEQKFKTVEEMKAFFNL